MAPVNTRSLIKTITKFSNVIGYQQPDLSINWTVYTRHACNWTVRVILGALLRCTLLSKLLCLTAFITTFNRSALMITDRIGLHSVLLPLLIV